MAGTIAGNFLSAAIFDHYGSYVRVWEGYRDDGRRAAPRSCCAASRCPASARCMILRNCLSAGMSKVVQLGSASLDDAVLDEVRAEREDGLSGPDSPEGREMGRAVGANVATLRAERGIDLGTMAERSESVKTFWWRSSTAARYPACVRSGTSRPLRVPFGSLLASKHVLGRRRPGLPHYLPRAAGA
ncbi:MAG: hypothetical protein U1E86_28645 [Burkholderiaceae bacterium]